jgi:hypothetical protein
MRPATTGGIVREFIARKNRRLTSQVRSDHQGDGGRVAFICKSVSASMLLNLAFAIAVSICCYAALILLLGGIDISELRDLRRGLKG